MKHKEFWIKVSAIEGPINDPDFTCKAYTEPKPGCSHLILYSEYNDVERELSRVEAENAKLKKENENIKLVTEQHLIDSASRYIGQQERIDELYKHNRILREAVIEAETHHQGKHSHIGLVLRTAISRTNVKQLEPLCEEGR